MDIENAITLITKINEATKDIPDEETRKTAFRILMTKAGLDGALPTQASNAAAPKVVADAPENGEKKAKKTKSSMSKGAPDIDADLNLEPEGKPSFGDFVQKRKLKGHLDQFSAAIYYLREILKIDQVGEKQVATCYKDRNWNWPADFKNTFSQGKSAKRFVYEAFEDVKLTAVEVNKMRRE